MTKKIKKSNIHKFVTAGILTASLIAGERIIAIHDQNIDHTQTICPISILEHTLTGKYNHQISKMLDDYLSQGKPLTKVYYDSDYHPINYQYEITDVQKTIDADGTIHYSIPEDYSLIKNEGKYIGVRKSLQKILLIGNDNDHQIPEGYEIRDINGYQEWVKVSRLGFPAIITTTYDFTNQKYNNEEITFKLER